MQTEESLFYVPQSRGTLLDKITQAYFKRAPQEQRRPWFADNSQHNTQLIGGSEKSLGQYELRPNNSTASTRSGLKSNLNIMLR
jgi:hypothetical protein